MNLILLLESDRASAPGPKARFLVAGKRAAHITTVIRPAVGATLKVGLLDGPLGTGTVVALQDQRVELDVVFGETPARQKLDVILAVPRPKVLRRMLPELAALGVDRLVLLRSWRVDRSYLTSKVFGDPVPLLHDGLMQARCTQMPALIVADRFRPFIEDQAPALFARATRFVAHPAAATPLSAVRIQQAERVVIAIGPEGGWIQPELDSFGSAGFAPISIGPRPLRVETATVALIANVGLLRGLP